MPLVVSRSQNLVQYIWMDLIYSWAVNIMYGVWSSISIITEQSCYAKVNVQCGHYLKFDLEIESKTSVCQPIVIQIIGLPY